MKSGGEVAPSLELYPLTVRLYRHCLSPSSQLLSPGMTVESILAGGLGTAALSEYVPATTHSVKLYTVSGGWF